MKLRILFALLIIFSISQSDLLGQANNLVVYNECGQKFSLMLNGKKIDQEASTYFKIQDLADSKYDLQLTFVNEKLKPIRKEVVFKEKGTQYTYYLSFVKGAFKLSKPVEGPLTDSIPGQPSPFPLPNVTNK